MSLDSPAEKPLGIRALPWNVDIKGKVRDKTGSERIADYGAAADDRLVVALKTRDQRALETLYDRYGDYVYSVCLRMVGDVQLAEDLTQEVFLRLWRRPDLYDVSRGRRFRHESPPSLAAEELLASAPANDGDDVAILSEERVVIEKALATLPAEQRLAIQLAYFGGYTQQEIAAGLSQPLGTVKTRIRLGLQKLRLLLIDQREGNHAL